jgi:imidazolonepropionase-like amidohydrolase
MNAKKFLSLFYFSAFLSGLLLWPRAVDAASRPLVIRNVTVIDATGAPPQPNRTVVIRGERIAALGSARATPVPKNAVVVNGRGKYLIPGLWDMHVQLWYEENQLPVYAAFGVTGVRDMGSNFARTAAWRAAIEKGTAIGPHVVTSGWALSGGDVPPDEKLPELRVPTPADARRIFDYLYDQNIDFIRILPSVPRFAYFALIEQGRHWGIPIAGDLPDSVSAWDAIAKRQSSIEHLSGLFLACSTDEEELAAEAERAADARNAGALDRIGQRALDTFSEKKAGDLFRKCSLFQTRQVPELTRFARAAKEDSWGGACDSRIVYVPRSIREKWKQPPAPPDDLLAYRRQLYKKALETVKLMRDSGVAILSGTGTGYPDTIPGATLHDELRLLVRAGLTPMEALQSATIAPARYLGWDDALGTIEKNKVADLVLLDADPLADIGNTQKIAAVVLRGKYLSKARLARILANVK